MNALQDLLVSLGDAEALKARGCVGVSSWGTLLALVGAPMNQQQQLLEEKSPLFTVCKSLSRVCLRVRV